MTRFPLAGLLAAIIVALSAPLVADAQMRRDANPFTDWAGFFVSGDFRAHSGAPSEVFDNGRRDVGKAFVAAGLKADNTVHFSVLEQLHQNSPEKPVRLTPDILHDQMIRLAGQAKGGCLFFYTSHGAPGVLVMGDQYTLSPEALDQLLKDACGSRPTVVLLSACFSGSFIPALSAANRLILTAAREDRASFGCGQEDTYTFFDGCLLEVLPNATSFEGLAPRVTACVDRRETELAVGPSSFPQIYVGSQIGPMMARFPLTRSYVVKTGDTLKTISRAMYGADNQSRLILNANRDVLASEAALRPGQTLKIPPV